MHKGFVHGDTTSGSASEVAFLDQVGLVDFLEGLGLLRNCRGERIQANGASFKLVNQCGQDFIVHFIETMLVHIEGIHAKTGNVQVDTALSFYLGKVAQTTQ